jgi:PAS domain S-box-containing protein
MSAKCERRADGSVDYFVGLVLDITKRKQAEDAQRKLASLVENSSDFIGMASPDGKVFYVNRAGQKLVGLTGEEHLRRTRIADYVVEEEVERVENEILPALRLNNPWEGEVRFRHFGTGAAIPMLVNSFIIREGSSGPPLALATISRDISELKRAEKELRRSEAHLAEAQRVGQVGSWIWNVATGECLWSREHFRIFGLDPETFKPTKENTQRLIHPEDLPFVEETLQRAVRERSAFEVEYRIIRPDGATRHHRGMGRPMDGTNGELEFIGMVVDVTERKQAEQALQEAHTELTQVSRMTAMGEMAASIAHEINQPLGAIVNNGNFSLRLVGNRGAAKKQRQALRDIVNDASRASAIIARVRALTKRFNPDLTVLNVRDLIEEVLSLAKHSLNENHILVKAKMANALTIHGDRIQLQQVLLNLIVNAIEAMTGVSKKKRILTISAGRDKLDRKSAILIAIADKGIGFASKSADRMFDAFYTTKEGGMGMGLRISRSIIEGYGGQLSARRNKGGGATFSFVLPV